MQGSEGGLLRAISAADGKTIGHFQLDGLPSWDGMAAARGRLFLSTTDARVISLRPKVTPKP